MSSFRNATRLLFATFALALPLAASAATFEVKAFIDSDNNRSTGCSAVSSAGVVNGIEQVVTTFGTFSGTTGNVTTVTRQTCTGGVLGAPVTVDGGWIVGVSSIGDLTIESRLGADIMTMDNTLTPRFVFTTTLNAGTFTDNLVTPFSWGGGDVILPHAARDRAVATRPLRAIVLDGNNADWDGAVPVALGTDHSPAWRFINALVYPGAHDLFFNFHIHTNALAPTAHDDSYSLPSLGATLPISSALGVLHNDDANNNSPFSATLVDNPHHGTVTLSANGAFTYIHDGSQVQQDQFTYVVTGSPLLSNVATVTIVMPGNNNQPSYNFTSPNHVTFVAGQFNTFQVTVTGKPTPALTEDGALPQVVSFTDHGDGTGILAGVPAPSAVGTYTILFHAEKNKPHQADQVFTLTVSCPTTTVTNPSVTTGVAGTPFSQTFGASGGQAPYTFSVVSGVVPAGMTFHPTGVLDGTPTGPGTFPIVVRATDADGCPGDGPTYTLIITCHSITVTNPATTTGTANAAFSQTFTQSGAVGTATFSLNSGSLPTGLTLSSAGVLSGTPTQTGSFPITVKVIDSNGCTGVSATYALVINCQTITVTNPATNTGVAGAAFSKTFTQAGSIGTATFSINSGTLPTGLTLSSAGVLSGTPTQTGSFPITVKVTDSNGCTGIGATYTITITCQTVTVTNPATTTGTVSAPFSQTFTQTGGIGTMTFTLASGSLPVGLTLSSGGVLSGSPTVTGSFPITVKATDSNGCNGTGATYTLVISCQTITVTNPATTTGTVSTPFSQTFTQTSAVGGATFSLNSGSLPTGLTLSSAGVLSGTPTVTGSFPITVKVTDGNGCTGVGATYTLVISCQTITVTNPATATGTAGTAFSQTFTQSGSIGGATFSLNTGSLPTGLTLSSAGLLSGTPTQTGSFPITVKVTDGNGCTGIGATYTLVINCQTITVTNPLTSTGVAGTAFSQTFTQSGSIGGSTFTLASGTLPTGLSLSTGGVLSGTPTQTGSFPITVTVTDGNGCTGTGPTYTLNITCQTITVTNPATTTATAGTPFSQTFTQSGAIGGATFSLNSGSLPTGLTLSAGGVLSGTPTVVGSFQITVKVTDGNGCTGIGATYTLVISCQTITVTNPATTTGTVNAPFSQTFTQSGAIGGATFTINSGTLPAGLSLSAAGVVSGTPTVNGSFPITVKVTDGNGCTGVSATYNLVINCQTITVTNPGVNTGTVGVGFSQTFTQSGAQGTATFTTASTLPTGFTLSTTGVLSGTTNQHNSFPIVVTVTDSNGCTGTSATYTLIISCQIITVTNPGFSSSAAGTPLPAANFTFTQSGAIGGATFTTASTLPTGVSLTTAGVLTGTPTQGGSFPIVVIVTDGNGCTGTNPSYTLTITCPTITVTNPGVSTGTVDAAFSQTFTQTGGTPTVNFTLNSGSLPAGLSLSTAGVLSGTPTVPGTFPITVVATDANGCTGIGATYNLVINCQTITVTNPVVSTGTVDTPFSQTFTQSGAGTHTPVTFTLNSGSLPPGLTLSSAGVLSGTPTAPGTNPITVKATDANGCFGVGPTYNLVISCQTITVTKPVVTTGTVDTPFSQTFTQSGVGTHTPATFTLNSGSLPPGLSLSAAGVLSGTPTAPGSSPITVKVTDANGCTGTSTTYTLVISCQTITVTNPATTTGTVGVAFSQTFTQSGVGTHTPATFTTASTLPTGFTLSTAGVLSGTTNQHGTFPIVVTVTDANGCTGTGATYNLVINCQSITVTNPGVNTGTVGSPFSQTFTQSGAIGGATFTTASALPTGLTLSTTGVLSGTPLQSGPFPIVVTVTDGNGCTGTGATYNLSISCNVITVTNPGVTTGTVDAAFSQTFTQSGGNGTITWSKTGAIPAGMTFHTATGVLDGTPSVPGSFPITVTATDANGCTGTGPTYTLVIACQTITVTNPGVTTGTVDAAFSQTFTQSGVGTHTPATFTLNSGSLPAGLSLSTAGVLSGTPTVPGTFPITVVATDANGCTGIGATYNLVINCQTITVTNPVTTTGTVDTPFSQTFTQSGAGTHTPVTFTLNSGSLPAGLTLSAAGVLSGTPTVPGTFPITVKATDANGCFGVGPTYNLVINCQTITVTKPVVTTGTVDTPFSQTFTQSGVGTHTPAVFSLNSGSLPSGLSLSAAGVLSGTPGQPGSFPITVKVTDANGCTGTSTTYTLVISCQTITVTNPATTTGTVGVAFSQTFTQSGVGTHTPATFTTASTLPTGFTLSTAGVLSGTTNQHGTFPIVVTVTDANGCTGTGATYNLVINCQSITVTNPGVNTGTVGSPFSQTFTQSGAIGGATFTTASALPTGLTLSTAGVLSGTPLQAGPFPIVVTVTDGNGCTGTGATYNLSIACNVITVTNPGVTTGTVDAAFSQTFTQSGGNGTITWSKTGAIPAGMTFHTATGVLDGTPSVPGSFPITVTATDANGCTGTGSTYTLVISCQTITVNNPGVTTGTVDTAFSQTFTQSGVGTHTPAVFSLNSGSLPSGLSLSAAGVLSGTPGQPGSFPITVKVTDANGCTGISATYTLVIACQTITVTNPVTTTGVISTIFSQTFTQSGVGTHTPIVWSKSGTIPTGMTFHSGTGVLDGTPTQTGTFPITVTATDANGCAGTGATYTLAIAPSAGADSYSNLVDNTQFVVTGGSTASPGTPFVGSITLLTANDLPAGGVTVNGGVFATSGGGSVTLASDGTFIYTPKANPNAAANTLDTFTYTVSSNTGGVAAVNSAAATVTLNLANRVWYVKNNAAGGGNGQSQSPFNTLATAGGTASTANDIIFVYNGDGTNANQNAGITLKNGQQLLGEINGLVVNAQTLVAAGSRPTIGNSSGAAVTVAASTANGDRTGIFIKGLSMAGTTNAIDISSANAQTLTATVDNVNITAATANHGVKLAAAATLTSTLTVQNSTISGTGQNGIDAQQTTAGNLVLSINNNNITATGTGINVVGTGSTSTTITNFATNTISGNTGGNGITVTTATFDTTAGGTFQTVSGGNTVIGSAGNGVGGAGMVLTNVAGDLAFSDLDIVASNGAGLSASGTTPYTGSAGFQIAVSAGVGSLDATNGPAADLNTVTANLPWGAIKSSNSGSTGVSLVTVPGTFTTSGATSSISNATSTDFNISGGNATVTYDGTISDASGRAVSIASTTGGTKTFSGAITNNGGTGISLTSNTGATINFSGTIILSTGSSDAFTATGGGTVSASDTNSTLTTTTGVALNVANTSIGSAGLKFKSITAGTAASGPTNGILLNNTGVAGGLTVLGTGSAGSGGTIQKTTGNGIDMTSTGATSLSWMIIQNGTHLGINGTTLAGFTLANSSVTGNGTVANADDGIKLLDVSGNATFTSDTVTGNHVTNLFFGGTVSSTTVTNSLTVTNGTYGSSATNSGIQVGMTHTSTLKTATFTGVTFSSNASTGLQVTSNDNSIVGDGVGAPATGTVTVSGCTFTNNAGNTAMDIDQGGGGGAGQMYARLMNNTTITGNGGPAINIFDSSSATGGTMKVRIDGNHVGNAGVSGSGTTLGPGIRVFLQGKTTNTITIVNNIVRQTKGSRAIDVEAVGPTATGQPITVSDIVITGNDADTNDEANVSGSLDAIYVAADDQGSPAQVNAEIHGNTVPSFSNSTPGPTGGCFDYPTFDGHAPWLYYRIATSGGVAKLFDFSGPHANANAAISATQTAGLAGADTTNFGGVQLTGVAVNSIP